MSTGLVPKYLVVGSALPQIGDVPSFDRTREKLKSGMRVNTETAAANPLPSSRVSTQEANAGRR
jgi:hypothetical protein